MATWHPDLACEPKRVSFLPGVKHRLKSRSFDDDSSGQSTHELSTIAPALWNLSFAIWAILYFWDRQQALNLERVETLSPEHERRSGRCPTSVFTDMFCLPKSACDPNVVCNFLVAVFLNPVRVNKARCIVLRGGKAACQERTLLAISVDTVLNQS